MSLRGSPAYFRIERDHLSPVGDKYCSQGRCFSTPDAPPKAERKYPVVAYLYDDDGILYFTVGCSDEGAAEAAHNWAQNDSGCTSSKIAQRGQPATPFIG